MLRDPLTAAALRHWPQLAQDIGLVPENWWPEPLARREDSRVARVLLSMRHKDGRRIVLKHEAKPRRPEEFMRAMAAHLAAHDVYPKGVPELMSFDVNSQTCLMEMIPAQPLSVVLEPGALSRHMPILRKVGAWTAGFHRSGIGEPRVFQPQHTIRFLRQIMDEVTNGQRSVLNADLFLRCAQSLCNMEEEFEGQRTVTAQTHGDLHMRNVLVGNGGVWGIDFAGGRTVPVGHDIARLLVDYATLRAPHDRIPYGSVMPPEAIRAFFEGYDLVDASDPSVQLLLRHRVLADWWGLPQKRSRAQERRWQGMQSLVTRVFASSFPDVTTPPW